VLPILGRSGAKMAQDPTENIQRVIKKLVKLQIKCTEK
jgi:hypothetical protein